MLFACRVQSSSSPNADAALSHPDTLLTAALYPLHHRPRPSLSPLRAYLHRSAGKSTLLRILAGKRLTSSTNARLLGRDVFRSPPEGVTYLGTEWALNVSTIANAYERIYVLGRLRQARSERLSSFASPLFRCSARRPRRYRRLALPRLGRRLPTQGAQGQAP